MKKRQENFIHADLSGVSRQQVGCKCVCSGGTSSDSNTIKEAVFCKVVKRIFLVVSIPSCPDINCNEEASLEGRVQKDSNERIFTFVFDRRQKF
jgi:hypothetical protein